MNRSFKMIMFVLSMITIILLVLVIVSASPRSDTSGIYKAFGTPVTAIQSAFTHVFESCSSFFKYVGSFGKTQNEIDELKEENRRIALLEDENMRLAAENEELRDLLNMKDYASDYNLIAGTIIAEDVTDWFNTFTINLGSGDGVTKDSPVITSAGLVGIVSEVGLTSSKITAVVDEKNEFMCRISRTNELVRVSGVSGESLEYELVIDRTTENSGMKAGDTVVTAESGGVFPAGIIVGTIKSVNQGKDNTVFAVIEPSVKLNLLSKVYVMAIQDKDTEE